MDHVGLIKNRLSAAVFGYVAGIASTAVGAGLQWGIGIGLIVGGVSTAASCLKLVDIPDGADSS